MIETGFESRIKIQDVIDNQLPEFLLEESPNATEFLKQYYISQEYQGGPIDIAENLDQYLKFDNLVSEALSNDSQITSEISADSSVIPVTSTKGFPDKYGLLKIDDEIITYTGLTATSFTGCIRGFSGITNYTQSLDKEELLFSESTSSSHSKDSSVQNLSSLFLKEFFKKLKYTFAPGLEEVQFSPKVNISNALKHIRNLYASKGTNESFKILFNILYGINPTIVNLEDFVIKPSNSEYYRREVIIVKAISGDPNKLAGQTITKTKDSATSAPISEVEIFKRNLQSYYKLSLFKGYGEESLIQGNFTVTSSTKSLETIDVGASVITVDSTIGFPEAGVIFSGNNKITYTSKNINQFFGCTGIDTIIHATDDIRSDDTYFGYENGDLTKKVEMVLVGVVNDIYPISEKLNVSEGDRISVSNYGEVIKNPLEALDKTYKEIFANSWIYNTSTTYKVNRFGSSTSELFLESDIDKSSLKVGDQINLFSRGSNDPLDGSPFVIKEVLPKSKKIILLTSYNNFSNDNVSDYDIRRVIRKASSTTVPIEFGDNSIVSDVQNLYNENDDFCYVASNSLPSSDRGETINGFSLPLSYKISKNIVTRSLDSANTSNIFGEPIGISKFSTITFDGDSLPFKTGEELFYEPENSPIVGLQTGNYFVELVSSNTIRLYNSRSFIASKTNFATFKPSVDSGFHKFTLSSQKISEIGQQKLLKKFPLKFEENFNNLSKDFTSPGGIGLLINGVEISNYKSFDHIYYGPLESIKVLNGGNNFDVVNLPQISVSDGIGVTALVQPVIQGSLVGLNFDPIEFDIDKIVSIGVTGGNSKGVSLQPIVVKKSRNVAFDGRTTPNSGGINTIGNTITFLTDHNFINGDEIRYNTNGNEPIGVSVVSSGTSSLVNNQKYYTEVINNKAIKIYETLSDYSSGINTVGLGTTNASGIHGFKTKSKNTLDSIVVLDGGNFTNRKLIVNPSKISTDFNTVNFKNHNFETGDIIQYDYQTTSITGLSSDKRYYVLKSDDNSFRLCDAGIGGTIRSNFDRKEIVSFTTSGEGYQYFKYPDITSFITYSSVGFGTTTQEDQIINTIPVIKGSFIDAYLYENGTGYGSSISNLERKPLITVKNGKGAKVSPIFIDKKISEVKIEFSGEEYFSTPELRVIDDSGSGTGAILRAVIDNQKITSVNIVNPGIGYSSLSTRIEVIPSGSGAIFDSNVRSLTVNKLERFGNELFESSISNNKLKYSVCGYSTNYFESEGHSPIIGWAYDGNPIYGPYGYKDPTKFENIEVLVSGYTKNINNIDNRPSIDEFPLGYFVEDYTFTDNGDLDRHNGRYTKTPEFPKGVYAYFATVDSIDGDSIFPYFIGDEYKSPLVEENFTIDQEFDFINSKLVRNTFPYKVFDSGCSYDFLIGSSEVKNQKIDIESTNSGSINDFTIVDSGQNYKVGDVLNFDEDSIEGSGLSANVQSIKNIGINSIFVYETKIFEDSIFTWKNSKEVEVHLSERFNFGNGDFVSVSGITTNSKLNGIFKVGVTSYSSVLQNNVVSSGIASTEIYVSSIPSFLSIGSSLGIGTETFQVLDIHKSSNIIRVKREFTDISHNVSDKVGFIPNKFTIPVSVDKFESKLNDKFYFNPLESIGFGTVSGITSTVTFSFGISTEVTKKIPTKSIFIENHSFADNQEVTLTIPTGGNISISTESDSTPFDIVTSGLSTNIFISNKGRDFIGIKTGIGPSFSNVFFISGGIDNDEYLLESNYSQLTGTISKITARVSTSSSHGLTNGDKINFEVKPNLSVGIRDFSTVVVEDVLGGSLRTSKKEVDASGIDQSIGLISINSHGYVTGDKVLHSYSGGSDPYFVYKIDDNNFKLAKTLVDATSKFISTDSNPSTVVTFSGLSGNQTFHLINPQIEVLKGNNLVFDLSDSSLQNYDLIFYKDQEFKTKFVSEGSLDTFNVTESGTPGNSGATKTLNYSKNLPNKLYYNLERSGYISTTDTDVLDYNEISYVDSDYNKEYTVVGVGTTTFDVNLLKNPERVSYAKTECDSIQYKTTSKTANGGIEEIKIISGGDGYKKVPKFIGSNSSTGVNASIIPKSKSLGKVEKIQIVNENFEYPSDTTLNPTAFISPKIIIKDSSTVGIVSVISGGSGYEIAPSIKIINSLTKEEVDNGLLIPELIGSSISKINILVEPKGLSDNKVDIYAVNNTNGISITKVEKKQNDTDTTFTCTIATPQRNSSSETGVGFSTDPFVEGDKVFIERIEKTSDSAGSGFNSEDHDYQFFTVLSYDREASPNNTVRIDASGLTTFTGTPKSVQDLFPIIVKASNYPSFSASVIKSDFFIGEKLLVNDNNVDLIVSDHRSSTIRVEGSYTLQVGDKIQGFDSKSIATIYSIDNTENSARFLINYSLDKNFGWGDKSGTLSDDSQFIPDNDYYQNLSYTVKSPITYQELVSPVNNLLHTSGLKNFADTGITSSPSKISVNSAESTDVILDLIDDKRVDAVKSYDFVRDYEIINGSSKFIEFKNKTLSDFFEIQRNLTLEIDNIEDQFSDKEGNIITATNIFDIPLQNDYINLLLRTSNNSGTEVQLNDVTILSTSEDVFLLDNGYVTNVGTALTQGISDNHGNYTINIDDITGERTLRFIPNDIYNTDYNIKLLENKFIAAGTGIGSTSLNLVQLFSSSIEAIPGETENIITLDKEKFKSIFATIQVIDDLNNINFVEIYATHDETNTFLAEYYFDTEQKRLSTIELGSFNTDIDTSSGNFILSYSNDNTSNNITVNSKIVGIGTTTAGIGTYNFKSNYQTESSARHVLYQSNYSLGIGETSIVGLGSNLFDALKSTIQISCGSTKALHKVYTLHDGNDTFTQQSSFIGVDETLPNSEYEEYDDATGIGTFGAEYNSDDNNFELKFYPDSDFSSAEIEVVSFNQAFYTMNDNENIPLNLEYGSVVENIDYKFYNAINGDRMDIKEFILTSDGVSIYAKSFDPNDTEILDLSESGVSKFRIKNHFFTNNEELIYTPKSSFVGIGTAPMKYEKEGSNYDLPSRVFAIVNSLDSFSISTESSGIGITISDLGEGNAHQFEMLKSNEKTLLTLDNIVQPPLAFTRVNHQLSDNNDLEGTGGINTTRTIFSLAGISSIATKDILRIDDEYMEVLNVGFGTTTVGPITGIGTTALVEVSRGFVGSSATHHTNTGIATVYKGSFNIVGDKIFFTESPRGTISIEKDINDIKVRTTKFGGRVLLRTGYESNFVFDDISDQFSGIGRTFTLTVGGANTTGIGTTESSRSGLVFINGLAQSPIVDNNPIGNYNIIREGDDATGITSISFTGIRSETDSSITFTTLEDVNMNELPRGGVIVTIGSSGGLGYAPPVGASVTVYTDGSGAITGIGTTDGGTYGSGYHIDKLTNIEGTISIGVTSPTGSPTNGKITATVGVGGSLVFDIASPGSGYDNPILDIPEPSYGYLDVIGISRLDVGETEDTGSGLKMSVTVGSSNTTIGIGSTYYQIENFKIDRPGYAFRVGDKFTPVGLVTDGRLESVIEPFVLEVIDVYQDTFSAWSFGDLDMVDSLKNYQNGVRRRFPLFYNSGSLVSFEGKENVDINYGPMLLVFINGVLQKPGEAYQFNGGTSILFTEAPKAVDEVVIYFFKGTNDVDTVFFEADDFILEMGDKVQIKGNNEFNYNQNERLILDISSSDKTETNRYSLKDQLSEDVFRPLDVIKQKKDLIVNGEKIYKTREKLESQIYPTAKIIGDITTDEGTSIFVDNSILFESQVSAGETFSGLITYGSVDVDAVPASVRSVVSNAGAVTELIIENSGSNLRYSTDYIGAGNTISLSISKPSIVSATTARAIATAVISPAGTLTNITIDNPGFGYSQTNPPNVLVPLPSPITELIGGFNDGSKGYSGIVTGIGTTSGIGNADLALKFDLYNPNDSGGSNLLDLEVGFPIHIFNTNVGEGVTSIYNSGVGTVGIGTTFVDNIYYVAAITKFGSASPVLGIVTCNIHEDTDITAGIGTTGSITNPVGEFSWGVLKNSAGIYRGSSPIAIGVSGLTVDAGLSSFPTISRRGGQRIGLRRTGALKKQYPRT